MGKKAIEIVCDNRKEFVNKIIKSLEEGHEIWKQNWKPINLRPQNPISNITYKGINRFTLAIVSAEKGYDDPRWVTIKQAMDKGYKLKEEEKPIICEKWIWEKKVPIIDENTGKQKVDEKGKEIFEIQELNRPLCTFFKVYNAKQFENFPELDINLPMDKWKEDEKELEILKMTDNFINSSECRINEINENINCYIPSIDEIEVMPREHFKSAEGFLGTVLHEMSHSTGHESRLNRNIKNKFGDREYAMEELVAELSTIFLEADLGINLELENKEHINYIGSWIDCLKENPNILYDVCKKASMASDFLYENYEQELEKSKDFEYEEAI